MKPKGVGLDKAEEYVEKWAPRLGFSTYRWRVEAMPDQNQATYWGLSSWMHDDEYFEIAVVPNVLPAKFMEALVVHELTHGFVGYAKRSDNHEETTCNRMARILLGEATQTPNEWAAEFATWPYDGGTARKAAVIDPQKLFLPSLVDSLPARELEVINGLYYEGVGLGTLGGRLALSKRQVGRIRDSALARLRLLLDELEEATA